MKENKSIIISFLTGCEEYFLCSSPDAECDFRGMLNDLLTCSFDTCEVEGHWKIGVVI
jgi:hypothetical protein